MTNDPQTPGSDDGRDPLEDMLHQLFGGQAPGADEIRRAMEGMGGAGGMSFDPSRLDPAMMQQAMAQFQAMMSPGAGSEGPVNWSLATQAARQAVAGEDPTVGSFARREVDDALRLAELWLDGVTETESTGRMGAAWSRAEWVEATMENWRRLTSPVAVSLSNAMSAAIEQQLPGQLPEGMDPAMLAGLQPMLKNMGGTMFGLQLGGAVGALGKDVLSGTDIGLPIAGHRLAMIPVNIEEFGDGLSVPDDQVRLYLALREVARLRLFLHSPWLERDLFAAIEQYAAGIRLDVEGIEEAAGSVDPMDPESMQAVFDGSSFIADPDATQRAALEQLELLIALVEGWVDVVVAEAAKPLESAGALRETMNRRRASGGPAEQAFAALVGLELRPRRLREAAQFWEHVTAEHGTAYREEIWRNPERQPTGEDLDDPTGYAARRSAADASTDALDDELQRLLDGGFGDAPKEG